MSVTSTPIDIYRKGCPMDNQAILNEQEERVFYDAFCALRELCAGEPPWQRSPKYNNEFDNFVDWTNEVLK